VYIAVKQIVGPTDILLCAGVNIVATEQRNELVRKVATELFTVD
jgi:hypothetical protein